MNLSMKTKWIDLKGELSAAWAISIKMWRVDLSYPISVLYFIVTPLLTLVPMIIYGFAIVGGQYSNNLAQLTGQADWIIYTILGSAFLSLMTASFWGTAWTLRREAWEGTIESLYVTPISRFTMIFGSTLHETSHAGLGIALQLILVYFLFGYSINPTNILLGLTIVALGMLSIQAIGIFLSSLVLQFKQGWIIGESLEAVFLVITPAAYPIAILPTIFQWMSYISPITYGTEAFRMAMMWGYSNQLLWILGVLIIIDFVGTILAMLIFKRVEQRSRKRGAVGKF
ncbi:MAG: ABC transporter permease [Candidatus Hodarchaeota archaeon]